MLFNPKSAAEAHWLFFLPSKKFYITDFQGHSIGIEIVAFFLFHREIRATINYWKCSMVALKWITEAWRCMLLDLFEAGTCYNWTKNHWPLCVLFVYIQVLVSRHCQISRVRQSMAKLTYGSFWFCSFITFFFWSKKTLGLWEKILLSITGVWKKIDEAFQRWLFSCLPKDHTLSILWVNLSRFWVWLSQPQWFKCQSCQWPELIKLRRLTDNTKTHQSLNYAPKCQVINLKWQEDQNRRISLPGHPSF